MTDDVSSLGNERFIEPTKTKFKQREAGTGGSFSRHVNSSSATRRTKGYYDATKVFFLPKLDSSSVAFCPPHFCFSLFLFRRRHLSLSPYRPHRLLYKFQMRRMWKKPEPAATATATPAPAARRTNNINNGGGEKKDATKMEGNR